MTGPFDKDFDRLLAFIGSGSDDRTLAIVCVAYADKYLGELLKYYLPGLNHDLKTKMFHPSNGSLGGFAARIDMAKALNIIGTEMYSDLKVLASIRNRFAHDLSVTSCDDDQIARRIANLRSIRIADASPEEQTEYDQAWPITNNRSRLESVGMGVCVWFHNQLNSIRHANRKSGLQD